MKPFILMVFVSIMLAACAGGTSSDVSPPDSSNASVNQGDRQGQVTPSADLAFTYEIETKRTDLPGGYLEYVHLVRSNDEAKQSRLNQLIEQEMTELLAEWPAEEGEVMNWDSTPTVHYRGANLLSFSLRGMVYAEGRPYPNAIFRGVTLDLENENVLSLDELIHVDDALVEWIRTNEAEPGSDAYAEDFALQYLLDQSDEQLLAGIKENLENHFYIERQSLTIALRTIHALGDWYELEMDGQALQAQLLQAETEWQQRLQRADNQTAWKTLDEIEDGLADTRNKMSSGVTTDMVEALSETHRRWDLELNNIWARYKAKLDKNTFAKLLTEQRDWLQARDERAEQAAKQYEGGTFARVAYLDSIANDTKSRCYELVERFE